MTEAAPSVNLIGLATKPVDATDLAFQADPAHKPDKGKLWTHQPWEDGWVRAHNHIRYEIRTFKQALERLGDAPLVEWQIEAIRSWWSGHEALVHEHHSTEDDLFNPLLRTRIKLPEKLEADHEFLIAHMAKIGGLVGGLTDGHVGALREAWSAYHGMMLPHLHEEEMVGLPLMRAYFAPAEIKVLIEKIMKKLPPVNLGGFLHVMGGKAEAKAFMKQEGIPGFLWHVAFKPARTTYRRKQQSQIDSLLEGKPVVTVHRSKEKKIAASGAKLMKIAGGTQDDIENAVPDLGRPVAGVNGADAPAEPRTPLAEGRAHAAWHRRLFLIEQP